MRTDLFDFELPAASIALRPASPRDSARMLIVQPDGVLLDRFVADLPLWLEPGDQLVVNDTKVIAAKLRGRVAAGHSRKERSARLDRIARRRHHPGGGQRLHR